MAAWSKRTLRHDAAQLLCVSCTRHAVPGSSDRFSMTVEGRLEYDGMLGYRISLTANDDIAVDAPGYERITHHDNQITAQVLNRRDVYVV